MKKLGRIIISVSELMENLSQIDAYLSDDNEEYYSNVRKLIGNGIDFVVYKSGENNHFAPSRFIGYLHNDLITHFIKNNGKHGSRTTHAINKILGYTCEYDRNIDKEYLVFCKKYGIIPRKMIKRKRKFWILDNDSNTKYENEYYEGTKQQVLVNKYERNPRARKMCIQKYGCICNICQFDFQKQYGELGKDFIHVHHIIPISENKGRSYKVDYENDLIPVCPNCHAMLHRSNISIEALKDAVRKNRRNLH
ncbi:hypothetical protein BARVI_12060 [Barnesiella viscericola DSM 18177]|uniref:HNH nuclease domain-containing protein n=1 Tax=Barnesiella viscericola DSM 18177 TaxID=880074 RepID=W0ERE0_9BACT|nr:HNH endonuclease [Barnesiella viscericola]AHF13337.1 hypothetical protein BARVI_12060 [Barnesiella viscericola DSM 18177]